MPANPIPAAAIRFRNSRLSMGIAGTGAYFPFLFASIAPYFLDSCIATVCS